MKPKYGNLNNNYNHRPINNHQKNHENNNNRLFNLEPASHTYAMVLQAWVNSNSTLTSERIDTILNEFHTTTTTTTTTNEKFDALVVPYAIVMRYYMPIKYNYNNIRCT
jgi:hypothetical protein